VRERTALAEKEKIRHRISCHLKEIEFQLNLKIMIKRENRFQK